MRRIGVVTTSRADYGIYRSILHRIQNDNELSLRLYVTGSHLVPRYGMTVKEIEADGFPVAAKAEILLAGDTPACVDKAMGLALVAFGDIFRDTSPDILLVLGDRFEMFAVAIAAVPYNVPTAHIHGGEVTMGAVDDTFRHALTRISHIHFAATAEYARGLEDLGEEKWRITVSGAPGLDGLEDIPVLGRKEMEEMLGISLRKNPILVTFHPTTRERGEMEVQITELLKALRSFDHPMIFSLPNADTEHEVIRRAVEIFVDSRPHAVAREHLGRILYVNLMRIGSAMVGNSSSGIIEAPSFALPVINVGRRQEGRIMAENIINVPVDAESVRAALSRALSREFRDSLKELQNPYKVGDAAATIVERLKTVSLDERLLFKQIPERVS